MDTARGIVEGVLVVAVTFGITKTETFQSAVMYFGG